MKRQRNDPQLKEQEENPERLNKETEIISLPDIEFQKEVIKMLTELRKITNINTDHCNKTLLTINMTQSKIDNSISEIKSNLQAMNS